MKVLSESSRHLLGVYNNAI